MVSKRSNGGTPEEERARAQAMALVTVQYKNWDIVWCRMAGYPWWPGVVFLDWDVVRDAELPLPKGAMPTIHPPERREVTIPTAHGTQETRWITDRYCLVMFLDKGDWSVANMNVQVQPFTLGYPANAKSKDKRTKTPAFRLALKRAVQLFHTSPECSEEDLALLNMPPQPKKRPRLDAAAFRPLRHTSKYSVGDWDDDNDAASESEDDDAGADDNDDHDDHDATNRSRRSKATARKPAASSKARGSASRQSKSKRDDDTADAKAPVGATHKKLAAKATGAVATNKREANGKVTGRARTKRKPKPKPKKLRAGESLSDEDDDGNDSSDDGDVEFIENPNDNVDDNDDDNDDKDAEDDRDDGRDAAANDAESYLSSTPLSKIWTTHADEPSLPSADSTDTTSKDDAPVTPQQPATTSSSAVKTLVYKQDFVWDDAVFTSTSDAVDDVVRAAAPEKHEASDAATGSVSSGTNSTAVPGEPSSPVRERPLGKRPMRSVQQSQIRQGLLMGNLDPHTMVQCESYRSDLTATSRGRSSALAPPFRVLVHPDAAFVCDLHAHLATCEIIGFLGGRWCDATQTLYVQAAFPCRSLMIDGDDGATDVEMDPGSEIELREIIQNAELEVVGWYHSHPAFAPDPSIRDIENQTSYQQLFQRRVSTPKTEPSDPNSSRSSRHDITVAEPFVGLIVGTYDPKRESPVSLFRYFHTRTERVSSGMRREVAMPYELVPTQRQFRSVVRAERRAAIAPLAMYPNVMSALYGARASAAIRMQRVVEPTDDRPRAGAIRTDSATDVKVKPEAAAAAADEPSSGSKRKTTESDAAVSATAVKDEQPVKRRRGRPRTKDASGHSGAATDSSRIDLTGDDGESEPTQSTAGAMDVARNASTARATDDTRGPSIVVIDVDAPPSAAVRGGRTTRTTRSAATITTAVACESRRSSSRSGSAHKPSDVTVITVVDSPAKTDRTSRGSRRSDATGSSRAIVIGDDAASATAVPAASAPTTTSQSVSSSAQPSPPDDDLTPTSQSQQGNGRRRGRKPVQTIRRPMMTSMFTSMSGDDAAAAALGRDSQRTVVSAQIAVYDAFGSSSSKCASGSSNGSSNGEHDSASTQLLLTSSSQESTTSSRDATSTTPVARPASASEDTYVYLQFDDGISVGAGASAGDNDDASSSNVVVLDASDNGVVAETPSQSSVVSVSSDASSAGVGAGAGVDEVVPESQSPRVKMDAKTEPIASESIAVDAVKSEPLLLTTPSTTCVELVQPEVCATLSGISESVTAPAAASAAAPVVTPAATSSAAPSTMSVEDKVRELLGRMCTAVELQVTDDMKAAYDDDDDDDASPTSPVVEIECLSTSDSTSAVTAAQLLTAAEPTTVNVESDQQSDSKSATTDTHRVSNVVTVTADAVKHETTAAPTTTEATLSSVEDAATAVAVAVKTETHSSSIDTSTATTPVKTERRDDVDMAAPQDVKSIRSDSSSASPKLFGSMRQVEDIRTSLQRIAPLIGAMRREQEQEHVAQLSGSAPAVDRKVDANSIGTTSTEQLQSDATATTSTTTNDASDDVGARWEARLHALRTKYGTGVHGCAEQVITLVDYYRDFARRIDLNEPWRARVSKLRKIEASMREYVQYVNVPVHLRSDFVEDVVAYLQLSWELSRPGR